MSVTYSYVGDTAYFNALMARYYRQRSWAIRPIGQFTVLTIPFALAFIYAWVSKAPWLQGATCALGAMIVCGVLGVLLIRVGVLARLKRGPASGAAIAATLSDEGLHFVAPHSETRYKWAAYPRSVRYSDGILLLQPGVICWLPDGALTAGTADAATELIRAHTKFRMVA
jgi:hypothetical protein